jgi:hypothetical protein
MHGLVLRSPNPRLIMTTLLGLVLAAACTETLDAGLIRSHGPLPVDERNPIVIVNDRALDNLQGEYAVLLANGGGPKLAGIVVNADQTWPDIDDNLAGWSELVAAARSSGLRDIPDPIRSPGAPLVRPDNGDIGATKANRSARALFLIDASKRLSLAYRPLVIVTGAPLTDVADAYLVDPTIVDRVYVVSSLGSVTSSGGSMGSPNGNLDPWADTIVARNFRYIQVSAFSDYDQLNDLPTARLPDLPQNDFGNWIRAKQPGLYQWQPAADQVAVAAVGIPSFVTTVEQVSPSGVIDGGATDVPDLIINPKAPGWFVTGIAGSAATNRLWDLLLDPKTFKP